MSILLAQNDADVRNDAAGAEALPPIDVGADAGARRASGHRGGAPQGPGDRHTGYTAESAPTTLKTDTPLLKTPISVQVVTRQTMDDQQAITVSDALLTNVSGVTPIPESSRRLQDSRLLSLAQHLQERPDGISVREISTRPICSRSTC